MSGGHWDYLSFKLEERYEGVGEAWRLLAVLEHELDWGLSGDTCADCARNRMAPALEAFFDTGARDASTAIAVARDDEQHQCPECEKREHDRRQNLQHSFVAGAVRYDGKEGCAQIVRGPLGAWICRCSEEEHQQASATDGASGGMA